MKLLGFIGILLVLMACQKSRRPIHKKPQIQILDRVDLYPQYQNCPDSLKPKAQLNCLMTKLNRFLVFNIKQQYQEKFSHLKDTLWIKFEIDTLGHTHVLNIIHLTEAINEAEYLPFLKKIAQKIPQMKPAVYHDYPVNFEFKVPIINQKDSIKP